MPKYRPRQEQPEDGSNLPRALSEFLNNIGAVPVQVAMGDIPKRMEQIPHDVIMRRLSALNCAVNVFQMADNRMDWKDILPLAREFLRYTEGD